MKKTALLAAAAALFCATPALAQSGGSIGLNYTSVEDDAEGFQIDGAFGGASGAFGFQLDAGIGSLEDVDTQTVAGHAYWNGGAWRLGGVVAFTNIGDEDDASESAYGVEGTFDLGSQAVILASYTVGEADLFLDDVDTSTFDIGLNYYLTENFRIGGQYGFGNLDGGTGDVDTSNLRLNAEWQPWTTPVSFTLGYNSFDVDESSDGLDSWSIGARWNFGGSLRERDNATPFDTRTGFYQRLYDIR